MALSIYDEILSHKEDEQSQISLQTIEYITKLFTNFAKYEYDWVPLKNSASDLKIKSTN